MKVLHQNTFPGELTIFANKKKPKQASSYLLIVHVFEHLEETQVTACDSWVWVNIGHFLRQGIPGTDGLPGEMGKAGAPVSFLTAFQSP